MSISNFSSHRAFFQFEREVGRTSRFVRSESADEFLEAVRQTCSERRIEIKKGAGLWRAQVGHGMRFDEGIEEELPCALPPARMVPLKDRAAEGRANPKGIPVLYLATEKFAAMTEVRPWLGSYISLGHFEVLRDLPLVDCGRDHDLKGRSYLGGKPSESQWNDYVWSDISRAFSRPVTRSDDGNEYVATQILTELFRSEEFQGVAYRSAFGKRAYNVALFDLEAARLRSCELHEAKKAEFQFSEIDNPYFVTPKSARKRN